MPEVDGDARVALRALIAAELDRILDPCSLASGAPMGLVEMGLVDRVDISGSGEVEVHLRLTSPFCHMIGFFHVEAERRLSALAGVRRVEVVADQGLDWSPARISPAAQARRADHLARLGTNAPLR